MQALGFTIFCLVLAGSLAAWWRSIPRLTRGESVFDHVPGPRRPVSIFAFASVVWLMTALLAVPWLFPSEAPFDADRQETESVDADAADESAPDAADETSTKPDNDTEADQLAESSVALLVNNLLIEFVIYSFLVLIWTLAREPLPPPAVADRTGDDSAVDVAAPPLRDTPVKELEQGALAFLLCVPLVFLVNAIIRWLVQDDSLHPLLETVQRDQSPLLVFLVAVNAVVMAPLLEELQFRVILQGWLADRISILAAIWIPALLFCSVHRFPDAFALVPLALILGWLYFHRGSYLAVVTTHALFNLFNLILMLTES